VYSALGRRYSKPPVKTMGDASITSEELVSLDYYGVSAINENSSSLFVDRMDLICQSGTSLTFQGLRVWFNDSTTSNAIQFDALKLVDSTLVFFSNTHTDYSVRHLEIAGGYVHSFWSQFGSVKIGKLVYAQSPYDKWGWTGFGYLTTLTAIQDAKRGKFSLVVNETETPTPMACYGLNSPRIINTDVSIQWHMSGKSYLYFPICLGNWSPTRFGFVVRDSNIVIVTNVKSARPDFPNNLHYQNVYLFGFPTQSFHGGNRVKIVADTDTENSILLTQDCHYDIRGQMVLRKHLYGDKESVPCMTINGGILDGKLSGSVKIGARVEGEAGSVAINGVVSILPTASTNIENLNGFALIP
jgi:hypothetical protein